ncbi:MAG: transglycosylase domain-containing protein [Slackia sp.]
MQAGHVARRSEQFKVSIWVRHGKNPYRRISNFANDTAFGYRSHHEITEKTARIARNAGLWTVLVVTVGIGAALFGCYQGAMALVDEWCKDLPDVNDTDAFQLPEQSTTTPTITTRPPARALSWRSFTWKNASLSSLDEVGTYVAQGTVATEDVRFYEHKGVDLQGIVRALS